MWDLTRKKQRIKVRQDGYKAGLSHIYHRFSLCFRLSHPDFPVNFPHLPKAWERQRLPVPRTWPVLDEEYLEWADVLRSAFDAAEHARPLRVAPGMHRGGEVEPKVGGKLAEASLKRDTWVKK